MKGGKNKKNEKEKRKEIRKFKKKNKENGRALWIPIHLAQTGCFAQRFPKANSAHSQNLLHRHSHSWSCHSVRWNPAKRTLTPRLPAAHSTWQGTHACLECYHLALRVASIGSVARPVCLVDGGCIPGVR
jgi:hypothetical protein